MRPPAPSLTKRLPSSSAATPKGSDKVAAEIFGPAPATVTTATSGFGGRERSHQRHPKKAAAAISNMQTPAINHRHTCVDREFCSDDGNDIAQCLKSHTILNQNRWHWYR